MTSACTRNLTVIARNATDGFYYSGFITSNVGGNEKTHHVVFHYIKPQYVPVNHMINIGGAVPWPELKVWDYVLVRVRCKTNNIECYVPGRVKCLPIDFQRETRLFTVELYTRNKTRKTRRYIVKIGKEKYNEIVEYINNIRHHHPIKFVSEPNLSRRSSLLSARQQRQNNIFFKKRRAVSAQHIPRQIPRMPFLHLVAPSRTSSASSITSTSSRKTFSYRSKDSLSTNGRSQKKSRTILPKPDEDVLARWQDDGWYYFGKVVSLEKDGFIRVLDSTGYEERIKPEDILINNENDVIEQYEKVIALHPRYVYSYAPATVLNVYKTQYRVQFYDDAETKLPSSEVYKISSQKFKNDVTYIKFRERKINGLVIARDDASGVYKRYVADLPDHQTQQHYLQLPNNVYKKQLDVHIFSLDAPKHIEGQNCEYVIAPSDPACTEFLPAKILNREPFRLKFCNEKKNDHAKLAQCFYSSEHYYKSAKMYFRFHSNNSQT